MSDEKDQEIKYEQENEDGDSVDLAKKIKKLKEKLKQCQQEKQEYLTGWQRCQADFINYKRRQEEQMDEWSKMFGGGLIRDLLPILDTLDAAIKNGSEDKGLLATREQLITILKRHGLEEIKAIDEKFNRD
ncbi:MAG: molecular chaperone GrpE [Parcubacteria group bacterium LiPW_39]|nr:MAG: molecular chaperone GrpE [Parcubacteria group bacterium LiPW_39]